MTSSPAEQESTGTRRGKTVALKDGSVHLLVGSASFRVEKGVLSSAGARLPAQTSVRVPFGRALPLEAEEPSEIVLFDGSETRLRDVGRRTVPEAWTAAADALVKDAPRLLLCLGFSYTGKNFFCTHLANRFRAAGKRVCVIDADPDQTEIGPPGCVGLLDMNDPVLFFSQALPTALQYVGSHSVIARPAVVLAAAQRLVNKALHERRAEVVLVNVPGWTAEDSGRCFHALLSTLLSPDRTIVLQRKDESEHLVRGVPVSRTVRLRASEFAARSSADERKRYREERTTAYYQNRRLLVLPFHHVSSAGASFLSGYPQKIVNEKILYVERMPSELEGVLVA
ncbi:MAG TPA: Clp1/GlmU family protein, partial [Elusimicrobiota bacterium]|nr:Clp1/GlmU family protein [Elusimicrobiota bacterium]